MTPIATNPIVHLELRTDNLARACAFYTRLFGWHAETMEVVSGAYLALEVGDRIEAGVIEHETARPSWLPYVEIADVTEATERARRLGASVALEPREGPGGWRSILTAPAGAEVALWQPKA
jgi:predicted enzyme related to lactoylglutathione lyase